MSNVEGYIKSLELSNVLLEEDRLEYQRLCREESPDFILNFPEYYGFFTYTLFWGSVINECELSPAKMPMKGPQPCTIRLNAMPGLESCSGA